MCCHEDEILITEKSTNTFVDVDHQQKIIVSVIFFFLNRDRVKHIRIERKTKIKLVHMLAFIFSWSQSHEKNIPALFTSRKRQFNGQSDKYYKLNLGFVYCTLMPHLMRCFYPFIFISFTLSLSHSLSLYSSLSHTHTHTHTLFSSLKQFISSSFFFPFYAIVSYCYPKSEELLFSLNIHEQKSWSRSSKLSNPLP